MKQKLCVTACVSLLIFSCSEILGISMSNDPKMVAIWSLSYEEIVLICAPFPCFASMCRAGERGVPGGGQDEERLQEGLGTGEN